MAKLDRLKEVVHFGNIDIIVTEQSHKKTKEFLKMLTTILFEGNNIEFTSERFPRILESALLEKPYEALKIFIPELTENEFDEASNRELIHAFKTVMKLNGIDVEKIIKNLKPLIGTVTS